MKLVFNNNDGNLRAASTNGVRIIQDDQLEFPGGYQVVQVLQGNKTVEVGTFDNVFEKMQVFYHLITKYIKGCDTDIAVFGDFITIKPSCVINGYKFDEYSEALRYGILFAEMEVLELNGKSVE